MSGRRDDQPPKQEPDTFWQELWWSIGLVGVVAVYLAVITLIGT